MNPAAPLDYEFFAPARIFFGWGRRRQAGQVARQLGRRAFIVSGSRTLEASGELRALEEALRSEGVEALPAGAISREPEIADVDSLAALLRERRAGNGDLVLAIGGGSAIDLAKAAAAMATNDASPTVKDYLEGVGKNLPLSEPPLPVLAMPTTSGTGSEATKNAVISSYDPPFKKSLRADGMVPRAVLIDPELTVSVPPATTAWTGLDAITQLIESYLTRKARPLPQALALEGLAHAAPSLLEAVRNGASRRARESMAHAALLSGMALANSGLGIAHGVAAALGVHSRVAHGLACAVMLPVALRVNLPVRRREMARLGEVLSGRSWPSEEAAAAAVIDKIEELCAALEVPRRLSLLGVAPGQIGDLVRSSHGNSRSGNPRDLGDDELHRILEEML
jgi:alcohol dehydrogenase class IV